MHPLFARADELSRVAIAAAIDVHREKGPGLFESIYEWCLVKELNLRQLEVVNQKLVRITYKGFVREEPLRFDLLIESCLLIEIKAVERILPLHKAQILSYMKLLDVPVGLLINFNGPRLADGLSRLLLPRSNL